MPIIKCVIIPFFREGGELIFSPMMNVDIKSTQFDSKDEVNFTSADNLRLLTFVSPSQSTHSLLDKENMQWMGG